MLTVHPSRKRPQGRVKTESDKTPSARTKTYPPPTAGLVTSAPLAVPANGSAIVMENFWPTTTGIGPRGGSKLRCMIAGGVKALFQYRAGFNRTYFAADDTNVYEFDDVVLDGATLDPVITGQTGANYSTLEMQTDGGSFLTIVNGRDFAQIYDGTGWQQVTDVSTPFAITGIATDRLSDIWSYQNRTFFIERGTMNAWYLGVNSVAGPATKLPLAGVFNHGGSLLFGATWSSDSGSSMDDRCVFATDQGEFAVFSGANPGDADDWHLDGVYEIGEPLGKHCVMRVGGDLIIATKAGLIPISAATRKDPSELKLSSLATNISRTWEREITLAGTSTDWQMAKWPSKNAAYIAPPQHISDGGYCYAVNLETGAWTKYTGWSIDAIGVLGDELYFGDSAGKIYRGEIGGTDDGDLFVCRACLAFDDFDAPGHLKTAHAVRGAWKYRFPINPQHSVAVNYRSAFPVEPDVAPVTETGVGVWGVSEWDEAFWAEGASDVNYRKSWGSVGAHGEVIAVQIQLTSGSVYKLDCELVSVDLVYSIGSATP